MDLIMTTNYLNTNCTLSELNSNWNQHRICRNFKFKRTHKLRISTFAATNGRNGGGNSSMTTALAERIGVISTVNGSSSSALDQLDIERGVCIPFRKYTPETV